MSGEYFYDMDQWLVALLMSALLLLATEAGFRAGCWSRRGKKEAAESQVGTIAGAVIGLLGLLLGFTFSMALARFDLRKQMVLQESNAIGTTYLRSKLLPEPVRTEVGGLLRSYVDNRLEFFRDVAGSESLKEVSDKTEQLHSQLWSQVANALAKDDRVATTGYFIVSLNEVIDLHSARLAATENHVPESVLLVLFLIALVATLIVAYGCGLTTHRHFVETALMSILIVIIITIIMDIDRPRRGLIRVKQTSMVRLQESMSQDQH